MIIKDDRTEQEKSTHVFGVVARDNFMSGWGHAKNGVSRCAWACKSEHLDKIFNWVNNRSEMKYVNIVNLNEYRPPKNTAHFHIYIVNDTHPALK